MPNLSTGESYTYDANGNMIERVEGGTTYTQNFDIENRLDWVTVNGQTTTFVYDGDGNLVKKLKPDGTSTVYIGGVYEVELNTRAQHALGAGSGGTVTKKTSYYPAGGAMRVEIVGTSNTLYFLLKDHLGSASVTLDTSGAIVANGEQRYYPFGENRMTGASLPTDRLYTGQRDVGLGGLYHYGARFYLSRLGRFISADTIVPGATNPQSFNRYSYSSNNPIRLVDPSGHIPCTPGKDKGCELPDGRDIDDCFSYMGDFAGSSVYTPNSLCMNLNWALEVNGEPVVVEGVSIADVVTEQFSVVGVQVQPQMGVYVELLVNGQDDNEKKNNGSGSSASAGGVPPVGGGGGDNLLEQLKRLFRGGAYNRGPNKLSTKLDNGTRVERHHIIKNKLGLLDKDDAPAIQMLRQHHIETSTWGNSNIGKEFGEEISQMWNSGRQRDAIAASVRDIRRKAGSLYNQALKEALDYGYSSGQFPRRR